MRDENASLRRKIERLEGNEAIHREVSSPAIEVMSLRKKDVFVNCPDGHVVISGGFKCRSDTRK
ncbi:MAG: hypothetical protein ACOYMK_16745, partial [Hyphomonadaceae bacterium]